MNGLSKSVAEWNCREMGRQRSPGASRSRDRHERTAPVSPAARIRRLLQRRPSSHSAERFAHGSAHRAPTVFGSPDCRTAPGWRSSPSLRVARSRVIRLIRTASRQQRIRRMNKENPQLIACNILNRMTELGRPESFAIGA